MSSHSNILVLGSSKDVQEVELKKRFCKLIDRLERSYEFSLASSKLPILKARMDKGEYFEYTKMDDRKRLLQIDWNKFSRDLCDLTLQHTNMEDLPKKVLQDIEFEIVKQNQESEELFKRDFIKSLEVSYYMK